jgi:hypothetical protein
MGKTFQERVKALQDFRPNIEFRDDAFILKIRFNKAWTVLEPEDPKKVAYSADENKPGLHWYVSTIENSDLVFDLIEQTIEVNKEMEKKITLYKEKVKELQELFLSDIPYNKLTTLEFTFPPQKKAKKKVLKEVITTEEAGNATCAKSEMKMVEVDEDEPDNGAPTVSSYIDEQISKAITNKS